ncbi:MAG: hypothetical protein H6834_17095 [Planctomycetes bacterium]|nr:hypothetical protein [Planctomycetota bacterium]
MHVFKYLTLAACLAFAPALKAQSDSHLIGRLNIVNTDPDDQLYPDLAYSPADDLYLVAWESRVTATDHDIFCQRIRPDGTLVGGRIEISGGSGDTRRPVVATVSSDQFLVVYQANTGAGWYITSKVIYSNGSRNNTGYRISNSMSAATEADVVAVRGNGSTDCCVVWLDHALGIRMQPLSVVSGAVQLNGPAVQVSSELVTTQPTQGPRVCQSTEPGQPFFVTWNVNPYVIGIRAMDMTGAARSAIGGVLAGNLPLPPFLEVDQPSIAGDGTNFLLAYRQTNPSSTDIYTRYISLPPSPLEPPRMSFWYPHDTGASHQERPEVAILRSNPLLYAVAYRDESTPIETIKVRGVSRGTDLCSFDQIDVNAGNYSVRMTSEYEGGGAGSQDGAMVATHGFRGVTGSGLNIISQSWRAPRGQERAVSWGDNGWGQMTFPALPSGRTWTKLSAGERHSIGLLSDGTAMAFGDNGYGQTNVPALPGDTVAYVDVDAGLDFSVALRSDGRVVAFGRNDANQLGVPAPTPPATFVEVAAGRGFAVARRSDGVAQAWGANSAGESNVPAGCYAAVDAGFMSFWGLGLLCDGSLVAWGWNQHGQVTGIPSGNDFVQIAAGYAFGLALRSDGTVAAWGLNTDGQLNVPPLPAGLRYVEVAAGWVHGLARRSDGSVVSWGRGTPWGQTLVPQGSYLEVSAGTYHSLAREAGVSNLGEGCGAGGVQGLQGQPAIGTSYDLTVNGAAANAPVYWLIAIDPTTFPFGCASCNFLFNSIPGFLGVGMTGAQGDFAFSTTLGCEPVFVGITLYSQFAVVALSQPTPCPAPWNAVSFTNILKVTLGE